MNINNKVVIFTANTSWYLFNFRRSTLQAFLEEGHSVHCIAPTDKYSQKLVQLGCQFYPLELSQYSKEPFKELRSILKIGSLIKNLKPDTVFSFTTKCNLYVGLISLTLNFRFIPNISGLGQIFTKGGILAKALTKLYKLSLKRAYRVIFQNNRDKLLFESKEIVKEEKSIRVYGSGVNLDEFTYNPNKNFSNRPLKFAMIARLLTEKGVIDYLDATNKAIHSKINAEFFLIGSPPNSKNYPITKKIIREKYSAVSYTEHTDNINKLMQEFDCLVLPTYYNEGIPKSLLEGLASGLIIITTNIPGCSETIDKDNRNGYFVDIKSPSDLAHKMIKINKCPPNTLSQMSNASHNLAKYKFDDKLNIEKYLSLA